MNSDEPIHTHAPAGEGPWPPFRVLCVDDDADTADSTALLLRRVGFEALACYDGPAALCAAEEFRPSVCLLDLCMPGINGVEAARRVREHRPDSRVVVYTNYVNPDIARGARTVGAILIEKGNLRALRRALVDA